MDNQTHNTPQQIDTETRQMQKVSKAFLAVIDRHIEPAEERRSAVEAVVHRQISALYSFDQWNRPTVPTQRTLVAHVTAEVFALCEGQERYERSDLEAIVQAIATKLVRHDYRVDTAGTVVTTGQSDRPETAA
ncbi:hypothetical protein [Nocardia colli]|uniref:hypothetical protein n=1 Tax=Nocardia colli TaxID=2545717 RepID=UPI0035DF981F